MNMFKKNEGFTLVELIVVIAILAILAAVAVPAYSGYITKAQEAADLQVITAVNTAIDAATATGEATVDTANYANKTITVTFKAAGTGDATDVANATSDYAIFMTNNKTELKFYKDVVVDGNGIKGSTTVVD